jgi:hypothetical protein
VQVTEEASSSQKRLSNTSKHEFFLLLWVIFALMDPDPDPYSNYGSGSGSNGPIEYGSNPDPDPKHWFWFSLKEHSGRIRSAGEYGTTVGAQSIAHGQIGNSFSQKN